MNSITKTIGFFLFLAIAAAVIFAGDKLNNPLNNPLVLAAIGVALLVIIFLVKKGNKLPDSDLHGSASWSTDKDIKDLIFDSNQPPAEGALILGPAPNAPGKRLDLPCDLMLRHTMMLGVTGSGKGRGFFLWQLPNFDGSFVYCDPKGEGWDLASGYRRHSWRLAPRQPDNSMCFNWIPLCGVDEHLCLTLALAIMTSSGGGGGGDAQFWVDAGSEFLAALFAHASTFENPTPAACYDFLTTYKGEDLIQRLLDSPNHIARQYATLFSAADPKLRGNVMIGATAKLIWLGDPKVRRFTSASLIPPDFGQLRKKKVGVYWVLSEKDVAVLKPLSTLFFTLVLYQLKEAEGKEAVCLLLDEVANIGRIPNLEIEITILRGRKIGLVLGIQSLEQLDSVYGKEAAKVIAGNCITKVVLAGLGDTYTAKYISDLLGIKTVSEINISKSKQEGFFSKTQISEQISKTARPLLNPDEVRRIGKNQQIIICENRLPIISSRFTYTTGNKTAKPNPLGEALTVVFPKPDSDDKQTYYPDKQNKLSKQSNQRNKHFIRS